MNCDDNGWKINGAVVAGFLFDQGDRIRLSVRGNSMHPVLKEGQTVSIEKLGAEKKLQPGEVYAFKSGGDLVVHRFVKMSAGRAVFAGDNRAFSEVVEPHDIVGRCEIRRIAVLSSVLSGINVLLAAAPFFQRILLYCKRKIVILMEGLYEEKI
jgi:hypothetical protein